MTHINIYESKKEYLEEILCSKHLSEVEINYSDEEHLWEADWTMVNNILSYYKSNCNLCNTKYTQYMAK